MNLKLVTQVGEVDQLLITDSEGLDLTEGKYMYLDGNCIGRIKHTKLGCMLIHDNQYEVRDILAEAVNKTEDKS